MHNATDTRNGISSERRRCMRPLRPPVPPNRNEPRGFRGFGDRGDPMPPALRLLGMSNSKRQSSRLWPRRDAHGGCWGLLMHEALTAHAQPHPGTGSWSASGL